MIILIIAGWLILGLVGSRLEYLFLKSNWTEEYHKEIFKRNHVVVCSLFVVFGVFNFFAGIIVYLTRNRGAKIR